MNILNKLTIKNLKLNKKRTIVTIIGIILSTALICAVSGMVSSFQQTVINQAIKNEGNRHLTVESVRSNDLKYFLNNTHIKNLYLMDNLGYALLPESKNENKPYLYIKAFTKDAFENTTVTLTSGRLPQDENELVISESIIKNGQVNIKVGDTLTLDMGERSCLDGTLLNQSNPYITLSDEEVEEDALYCEEQFTVRSQKEYKVVGIMERPSYSIEGYEAPGYSAYTYTDTIKSNDIDVNILFKDVKYYKDFKNNLSQDDNLNKYNINLNSDLLRWTGASVSDSVMRMLMLVAGVVIIIIILTSVFVIKNSFDISIVEKTKQYGMLSSIGATSKQIKQNVLYEGLILGLIGIPLGILGGVFADFVLVWIVNILGADIFDGIKMAFKVPLLPILLSVLLSALTIFLSVIKTARKTSKISPIVAIRNNNEIKIKSKKLRTPKIIKKVFGIGGEIAYKNLKRSRKKYRTTVISIVVSIAVFISLSTFINYGFKITGQYYTDYQYNLVLSLYSEDRDLVKKAYQDIKALDHVEASSFERRAIMDIDAKVYMTDEAFKLYYGIDKNTFDDEATDTISIYSLGEEEYNRFIKKIGGKVSDYENKAILIDNTILYDSKNESYNHLNLYDFDKYKTITGKINDEEAISIEIVKRTDERPMGLEGVYGHGYLIVSDSYMDEIKDDLNSYINIKSDDADKLEEEIKNYLSQNPEIKDYYIYNVDKTARAEKSLIILVAIFLYGFITVISLIGITNIFNTLTTNMNLRRKEFAMLKSIGMTNGEFKKMIGLESLMYCTKALIIGIPLGLLGAFLIYKAFATENDMNFMMPWMSIIISIIVVYILVSLIMYFSLKKTKKQNIIETIRNDNI